MISAAVDIQGERVSPAVGGPLLADLPSTVRPIVSQNPNRKKVLFVTSEFADLVKTGGLGDVSAALPRAMAHQILDVALDAARSGAITDFTATTDALLEGHQCAFVRVPVEQYRNYVGYARWYYQGDDFMLYQIVWPSRDGHFPWQAQASAQYVESQPLLGPAPLAA